MVAASHFDAPFHQRESVAASYAGWRVCAIALVLFVVAATLSAIRKESYRAATAATFGGATPIKNGFALRTAFGR